MNTLLLFCVMSVVTLYCKSYWSLLEAFHTGHNSFTGDLYSSWHGILQKLACWLCYHGVVLNLMTLQNLFQLSVPFFHHPLRKVVVLDILFRHSEP